MGNPSAATTAPSVNAIVQPPGAVRT